MATCIGPFGKSKGYGLWGGHFARAWVVAAWLGCPNPHVEEFGASIQAISRSEIDEFRATYAIGGYDAVKALAAAHPNL